MRTRQLAAAAVVVAVVAGCSFDPRGAGGPGSGSGSGSGSDLGSAGWWDTSFGVRFPIQIDNLADSMLPGGFQVGFRYDLTGAPCNSAGSAHDDVRIVFGAGGGSAELARVIDDVDTPIHTWTWFRLSAALAAQATDGSDYWLYCDNPAAGPAPSDPTAVFDFYDGFDEAAIGSAWKVTGAATIANGALVCDDASNDAGVESTQSYAAPVAIDFAATATGSDDFWWGGFQQNTMNDNGPWALWYENLASSLHMVPSFNPGAAEQDQAGNAFSEGTTSHVYGVENYGGELMWRADDDEQLTIVTAGLPSSLPLRLWNGAMQQKSPIDFDWVRVRQAVSQAPMLAPGPTDRI